MYGGRQFATYDQGWLGWFCQKAVEAKEGGVRESFTISGSGKQVRDVLHAEDMKRVYFAALTNIEAAKGQVFNIGGGAVNSLSLLELLLMLEDIVQVELSYTKLPVRESDQRFFVADISKARRILGWVPEVTPEEGVTRMIEWTGSVI